MNRFAIKLFFYINLFFLHLEGQMNSAGGRGFDSVDFRSGLHGVDGGSCSSNQASSSATYWFKNNVLNF